MLFLEEPIELPLLNVRLPLTGFFVAAPAIFLTVHFYLLLQMTILRERADAYVALLNAGLNGGAIDRKGAALLRHRLDSSLVLFTLAGSQREASALGQARKTRNGALDHSMRLIAWLTTALLPLGLLCFMQIVFLPYHDALITNWHRLALIADGVLLWVFWSRISSGRPVFPATQRLNLALSMVLSATLVAFSLFVAVFPTEYHYNFLKAVSPIPVRVTEQWREPTIRWISLTEWLFEGPVDDLAGKTAGILANRIVVADQDFADDGLLDELDKREADIVNNSNDYRPETILSFRNRNLVGAILDRTDLRRSDFTGARLDGASLSHANLDRSVLGCADEGRRVADIDRRNLVQRVHQYRCTSLAGAVLNLATLRNANLEGTVIGVESRGTTDAASIGPSLRGATLDSANLQGALLNRAELQGAILDYADLQGASLDGAQLQGASLYQAKLRGASLYLAGMQGTSLLGTEFQGASLEAARLQGARLSGTQLQGAMLDGAFLTGASLYNVQLQGTSLKYADLDGADLYQPLVWRADVTNESDVYDTPLVLNPNLEQVYIYFSDETGVDGSFADLTPKASFKWLESVPRGRLRNEAELRLRAMFDGRWDSSKDIRVHEFWLDRDKRQDDVGDTETNAERTKVVFKREMLTYFCDDPNGIKQDGSTEFAFRGMVRNHILSAEEHASLTQEILTCQATKYFDEKTGLQWNNPATNEPAANQQQARSSVGGARDASSRVPLI